jgi:hypothetical protein
VYLWAYLSITELSGEDRNISKRALTIKTYLV